MKSNKVYLIKTLTEPVDDKVNDMLSEVGECFDLEDEGNFVVEDVDGLDYLFLRVDDYKVNKICNVLNKYIKYEIEEITNQLILGGEGKLEEIVKSEEFRKFFENFRIESMMIDDVLDKINFKGIDSLDDIDKQILAKG